LVFVPLIILGYRWAKPSMVAAVSLMVLLMLSLGLGFWGSSYAPTGLYVQGTNTSLASGRPLVWPGVASFLSFSGKPDCILTNEMYVTSMGMPVEEWNISKVMGNVPPTAGCFVVVSPHL